MAISIDTTDIRNGPHFDRGNYNYNSGIVGLEAYIEPYCPFTKSTKQTFNIILNHVTVTRGGFSEEEKKNISSVPGLEGIFLRENYRYLSNYLLLESGKYATGPRCFF